MADKFGSVIAAERPDSAFGEWFRKNRVKLQAEYMIGSGVQVVAGRAWNAALRMMCEVYDLNADEWRLSELMVKED
jgi:hypothetical protein